MHSGSTYVDEQTLLQNHACFPIIIKDNNSYWTQQKHSNNKFDTFWIFNAPFNYMYGKVWAGHLSRPAARCNAVQRCRPACCNAVPSSSNVVQLLSKSGLWCHFDFNIVTAMGIVAQRWALFSKHLTSVINQPHIQAWLTCYVIIDYW